jgi:hypothetical protein
MPNSLWSAADISGQLTQVTVAQHFTMQADMHNSSKTGPICSDMQRQYKNNNDNKDDICLTFS